MEPPGIAPGSSSLITWAFIPIVGPKPDTLNIGASRGEGKSVARKIVLMEFLSRMREVAGQIYAPCPSFRISKLKLRNSIMSRSSHLRAAAACGAIFVMSIGGLAACSKTTTDKVEDTTTSVVADASAAVSSIGADMDANKTQDFVTKAAIANMFEIKTSELAVKTSKNADVLAFAKMMIKDHTAAGKKFETAVAATSGLTPPAALDDDHQKKLDDLATKTGTDFDKAYVDIQQSAHSEAVSLFDDYSKNGKDAALQTFATNTLPTLQAHKDKIDAFKE